MTTTTTTTTSTTTTSSGLILEPPPRSTGNIQQDYPLLLDWIYKAYLALRALREDANSVITTVTEISDALDSGALGDGSYEFLISVPGLLDASAQVCEVIFATAVTYAVDFDGSLAEAQIAATAETIFSIQQNNVEIGTLTFAAASTTGTFVLAAETTFAVGDILEIIGPNPADVTLSDLAITFKGAVA